MSSSYGRCSCCGKAGPLEEWRPVPGFELIYEASNLGRIKSLPRRVRFGKQTRLTPEKILKGSDNGRGYKYVAVPHSKHKYIHVLVASAFLGPIPEGCEVNHKDADKSNNRPCNLEFTSRQENMAHAKSLGRLTGRPKGVKNAV